METTDSLVVLWAIGIALVEGSYFPQLYKLYVVKKAQSISIFFPAMNLTGRCFAALYGFLSGELDILLGFLFGILVRGTFVFQVWYYKKYPGGRVKKPEYII